MLTRTGGCHCGKVRFRVTLPERPEILECSCSMCERTGFRHLIVARDCFELLEGEHELTEYRFNTGTARHLFCSTCGIKSYYVPRSHPGGISVNERCLDERLGDAATVQQFDGADWEAHIHEIAG